MKKQLSGFIAAIMSTSIATSCTDKMQVSQQRISESTAFSQKSVISPHVRKMFRISDPKDISFDRPLPITQGVPGQVTVIFRDADRVRVDQSRQLITSLNISTADAFNDILTKNKVVRISAPVDDKESGESNMDVDEVTVSQALGVDVPHWLSVQTIQFPSSVDTTKIAAAMRTLPFVRTAYPTPKITPCAGSVYSCQGAGIGNHLGGGQRGPLFPVTA